MRILGLGNELLADDAFGIRVARALGGVWTSETGLNLLDYVVGARRLVVVDTLPAGAEPGTLHVIREVVSAPGDSPHRIGLFETLALARALGLPVPEEVLIVAVEPADCLTVGGPMHPAVEAAIPRAVELIRGQATQSPISADA